MKIAIITENDNREVVAISPELFKKLLIEAFEETQNIEKAIEKVEEILKEKTKYI